ncbi:MAG: FdrA family protein [Elusimicrobia bacterium]|nr:MAG: FdrA family protein [Elusimicrobiota bacterium]KAF0155182.1 MAG: FdrA family protein [Elusimicrobiota bacterium]
MPIKTTIKKGAYFDSVALMQVAKKLNSVPGVIDSAVVMATKENKSLIKASGLLTAEVERAGENDLAIAVSARTPEAAEAAFNAAEELLNKKPAAASPGSDRKAAGLDDAVASLDGANLAVISVAGRFAGALAADCLDKGLNVVLFSDNVPVETEVALKKEAVKKGLLVMGPDCGTAIINGAPIAFANSVRRGNIGVVAASGTGAQEVTTLISNEGAGISQCLGTGGRDVKAEVGGLTFLQALSMLAKDEATQVILLVSKPPHPSVMKNIAAAVKRIKKPVVAVLLGGEVKEKVKKDFYPARTLEEAAYKAACLGRGLKAAKAKELIYDMNLRAEGLAKKEAAKKKRGRFLRGLFTGGTFVGEAQVVLPEFTGPVLSNAPLDKKYKLKNSVALSGHAVIDLGEDEFTVGRPHPMIDFSLRNKMIVSEAKKPEVSVLLLDLVLGYGANLRPLDDILPPLAEAFKANRELSIVASVTGTEADPQVRSKVVRGLEAAGVLVMPSNAGACRLAGEIIRLAAKR